MRGSERLRAAFSEERVALIPYLTAGYPTLDGAREVGEAYVAAGADVVEIGVPFSDRVPVVFLVYYNVVFARGVEEFLDEAEEVSGVVIPDLPVDEAERFAELSTKHGVAFCPLAAPTSTDERLARVGELASGFVYCVSVAGVTGAREVLPPGAVDLLRRARREVEAPVVLGFGIGSVEAATQ